METFTFQAQPTPSSVSVIYSEILKHPEQFYQGSDLVWVLLSSATVFLMIPALSFINAGLGNRSFSLTLFRLPLVTAAFVGLQWVLWGYALTFSSGILWWGGEIRAIAANDVLARPVATGDGGGPGGAKIPELVYMLYEAMFASFTAAVVCGGTMHRARPARFIVFITFWSFLIYFPVARWSWSSYGWSKQLGTLDFAGGTPVHIVSGTTVAAFSLYCSFEAKRRSWRAFSRDAWHRFTGMFDNRTFHLFLNILAKLLTLLVNFLTRGRYPRPCESTEESADKSAEGTGMEETSPRPPAEDGTERVSPMTTNIRASADRENGPTSTAFESQPSNVNYVVFGTALLWFGWAGFNGGSALGGNMRAVSAWTATHIAACAGGVTGMFCIWFLKVFNPAGGEVVGRLSVFYFCDGAIAGLVAITPGAGYVPAWSAVVFGVVSAFVVLAILKKLSAVFLRNDPLQIFPVHAGGGLVGMALTAFFVKEEIIGLDGHSTLPHPEYTMGRRLGYQLLDGFMGMAYTFVVTIFILYSIKLFVGIFLKSATDTDVERYNLEDEYQATMTQYWRSGLDSLGRPRVSIPLTAIPPERAASTGTGPGDATVRSRPEPEHEVERAPESTGAPTSSAFTPVQTPASTSALSPAGSLAPHTDVPLMGPFHDSFYALGGSRDPSISPQLPPVHRAGR